MLFYVCTWINKSFAGCKRIHASLKPLSACLKKLATLIVYETSVSVCHWLAISTSKIGALEKMFCIPLLWFEKNLVRQCQLAVVIF